MANLITNLGVQISTTAGLQAEQRTLSLLTEQLASNKQNSTLTDYAPADAQNLMNFQNAITQHQSYISATNSVDARLKVYDLSLSDLETIASQAQNLATQNPTLDTTKTGTIQQEALGFMRQTANDLNQKVGNRYIFAGTRYSTAPVIDLTTLSAPTLPFTPTTSPTLPDYDSEYSPPGTTTDASAFVKDSVNIDTSNSLTYGVVSTDSAFQNLIAGLRLINAASQETDPADYATDMNSAATLLSTALSDIQTLHAGVASSTNIISQAQDTHNQDIANLQDQVANIQQVDITAVGTKLNLLQTQLQASYSATATLTQLSILKYL